MISCVPSAVLEAGSSRHMPEVGLTSSLLPSASHCWLAPPLHGHHSTSVPSVYLAPVMSRQPPSMVSVPLLVTVQFCAAVPSHAHICTLLPSVPLPLLLSTQSELSSRATIA